MGISYTRTACLAAMSAGVDAGGARKLKEITENCGSVKVVSQETIDETRRVSEANAPYWRPIRKEDGTPTVACMQPYDEFDYDQNKFMTEGGFPSEEEAWRWIDAYKLQLLMDYAKKQSTS